jgi:hypothetical protein
MKTVVKIILQILKENKLNKIIQSGVQIDYSEEVKQ